MSRPFPLRGVIEGFYGPPWSHVARVEAIEFLAARGMNAYVYAPKSDPLHRERWREPYPPEQLREFEGLADACGRCATRFGFAISPGLDIDYGSDADRAALLAKLMPLTGAGVDWIVLALDDIAARPGLAAEQGELTSWLREVLAPDVRISVVPTEYIGTRPTPYLVELDAGLPPDVDVFWTGPTVCSPTITAADARAWRDAIGGRPLLIWDNYPVNDSVMEHELHLGAYRGREPGLADVVDGVLCNPMIQPRASLVALATAADFLTDPLAYDEDDSWARAIAAVGSDRADALVAMARACRDGPLARPEELPLHDLVVALSDELDGPGWPAPLRRARAELDALRAAAGAWQDVPDDPLATELGPWLGQAGHEAEAGLAALRLLQQVRPIAVLDASGAGRAAAPDAGLALQQCFTLLFVWAAAREASREIVLGPRFGLHAAVVQLADGRPALDIGLALREDASVIDHLARLALDHYERWADGVADGPRGMVDGAELPLDADGRFRSEPGSVVLVRAGNSATRVTEAAPPFRDPRLG
ncbi:MAG: protein O-GlcNAcase [Acidimicrobiia bacterium]|nr:protein O-GlcNAcase [Acidimicrobiia bacterium]